MKVKYAEVIEKTCNGYPAYMPDLPACLAAGDSRAESEDLTREASVYYLEMLHATTQSSSLTDVDASFQGQILATQIHIHCNRIRTTALWQ